MDQAVYVASAFVPAVMAAAKFSILYLYNRVFSSHRGFRIAVICCGVFNLLWCITATIANLLKCIPVAKSWDPTIEGTCYNISAYLVAIEAPNAFLDFVMVGLPLMVLRSLKLPLGSKISLGFIFVLGGL